MLKSFVEIVQIQVYTDVDLFKRIPENCHRIDYEGGKPALGETPHSSCVDVRIYSGETQVVGK